MKKLAFLLLLTTVSCSEPFNYINPSNFNKKIAELTDIKTPEELIILYYTGTGKIDNNLSLNITTVKEEKVYTITLINNNIKDDSVCGEKLVIKAVKKGENWHVLEIKENHRCCKGRGGPRDWSTQLCP